MKIFKKFFKAKWQSDDAQIRLKAIEELTPAQHQKELTILVKDKEPNVRLAALSKLEEASHWLQAYLQDKDSKVKTKAEAQIRGAILGNNKLTFSEEQRNKFLREHAKPALLEEALSTITDDALLLASLEKLGKETLTMQYLLADSSSEQVKQSLFTQINQKEVFEKLAKKAKGDIQKQAEQKLAELELAETKPLEVQKQVNLILAKLNALRDKSNIVELEDKRSKLEAEWSELSNELHWLTTETKAEAQKKLLKIQTSLDSLMGPLREQWELSQAQKRLQQAYQESTQTISVKLAELQQNLSKIIVSVDRDDDVDVLHQIQSIEHDLENLQLPKEQKRKFAEQLETFRETLSEVPKVHQTLDTMSREQAKLAALPLPSDTQSLEETYPEFLRIKKEWRELSKALKISVPAELDAAFVASRQAYQAAAEPLQQQQKEKVQQFKKKQNELKRLLFSGKYRSAFGLHKKLTNWLAQIHGSQRDKLKVEFDKLSEKVKELQELQSFIALPRKKELLTQLQELAKTPLTDVLEQGERVKKARADWNSLGKNDSAEDAELNRAFNTACEEAFAPCRAYYAEQEQVRNDNLLKKHKLLDDLRQLTALVSQTPTADASEDAEPETTDDSLDVWSRVESGLARINKEWRAIGEIDRAELSNVNKLYTELTKPLRKQLTASYQNNADKKQALIDKATQLAESDDIFDAVNSVKDLQKTWKTIGFAGPANEKLLWKAFREVNDALFAKRDEMKQEQKAEIAEEQSKIQQQLKGLDTQLANAEQFRDIKQVEQALAALEPQINAIGQTGLQGQFKGLFNKTQQKAKQLLTEKHQAEISAVFDAVEAIKEGDSPELSNLDSQWQDLLQQSSEADAEQRRHATIRLEVIAGVDSPVSEEAKRWEVKVKMMTDKLQAGEDNSLIDGLKQWLALGKLTDQQMDDLQRVKAIFLGKAGTTQPSSNNVETKGSIEESAESV